MGSTTFPSCSCFYNNTFNIKNNLHQIDHTPTTASSSSSTPRNSSCRKLMFCLRVCGENDAMAVQSWVLSRRSILVSGMCFISSAAGLMGFQKMGLLSSSKGFWPGECLVYPNLMWKIGWRTYRRPDEKSGGHGVGWSPIIPYTFSVPTGWEEVPVSIADLGGTEIDLRFANPKQGRLSVIVAPVLRFADNLGDDVTIEKIGKPDRVITAFGPEVIGENVEGKVLSTDVVEHDGRTYYQFELEPPHVFITATAAGNRLYLFSVTANGLQWKKNYKDLKRIANSFRVL